MQNRLTDTGNKKQTTVNKRKRDGEGRIRGMGLTETNDYT